MHPQLAALVTQLHTATTRARRLAAGVDDAAFQARPPRGGWSAAECLTHLSLTTAACLPGIDAALAVGRPGFADTRRYRRGWFGSFLAWSLEPPVRLRLPTQPAFVPRTAGSKEGVLADFEQSQRDLAERMERASGLHLTTLRITSVFNARLSYNVYAAFCILTAHEHRHLWQAERAAASARTRAA